MTKSDNEEREQRILDAAAELFVHYGYDKTTVSDIAREAGVSKGAIYLHFKSKDDLLGNLLLREMQSYAETWLDLVDEDPRGGTLAGMYTNSLYALNDNPFMAAMFRKDGHILGSYMRKPDNIFRSYLDGTQESPRYAFVKMMQDAGAIRTDIKPEVIAHIMDMLAYGLVGMDEIKDKSVTPPVEAILEAIAIIMDKALTPDDGGNIEAGKEIVRQISVATRQQFEAARKTHTGRVRQTHDNSQKSNIHLSGCR